MQLLYNLSQFVQPDYYDVVFHLDGSKENLAHLFILKHKYGLSPLSTTFNHHFYTASQKSNIRKALEVFDLDNLMLTARISVVRKYQHHDEQNFPQFLAQGQNALLHQVAIKYHIPLIIKQQGATGVHKLTEPLQSIDLQSCPELDQIDTLPYQLPSIEQIQRFNLHSLNLEKEVQNYQDEIAEFLNIHFSWNDQTIQEDESFWIGSPEKKYIKDAIERLKPEGNSEYEELAQNKSYGDALYGDKIRYCTRCCMPETAEDLEFDELGICQPCQSSEQKMHINWNERREILTELLEKYSGKGDNYDCMIPISGGKDSTFQMYVLTHVFKRRILAVTFSHNWYSDTGRYNLMNAIKQFDTDHLLFTPRRDAIHRLARKSLYMIGDACWHCHAGVGAFPLQVAIKWNVPFLIWGESVAENDGRATYDNPILFDRDYFTKISARYYAEEMINDSENISKEDVLPYILPSYQEMEEKFVRGIHLGDYMFWDDERQMEFVRDNFAWREDNVEGTYKRYKSVECIMAGVHDYSKFIKRGYGRGTDHASQDVKSGLLTREEGFELAKKYDTKRPDTLYYYLDITGYSEQEFDEILKEKRDEKAQKLS